MSDINAAIKVYLATLDEADRELAATIKDARATHARIREEARVTCQAFLDANSSDGISITTGPVSHD